MTFLILFLPTLLLRILDSPNGLCNETRLVCRSFSKNIIHVEIAMSDHAGKQVFLPRIPLSPPNDNEYPFKFKRKQFPIHLSFVMTINKAQGQKILNIEIYLHEKRIFSWTTLYCTIYISMKRMKTTTVWIKPIGDNKLLPNYIKKMFINIFFFICMQVLYLNSYILI